MTQPIRIGSLQPSHRSQIEHIVRATGVFSNEEVGVAMEVFDEATAESAERRVESDALSPPHDSALSGRRAPLADYELLGAFSGDDLVGYACFGPTPATDRTFDLYWIAVHPSAQRSGAGAALMAAVEDRLEQRRARLLVIETSSRDDYAPTRRFYAKRGYEQAVQLRDFYAPGDDRIILTKRFAGAAPS